MNEKAPLFLAATPRAAWTAGRPLVRALEVPDPVAICYVGAAFGDNRVVDWLVRRALHRCGRRARIDALRLARGPVDLDAARRMLAGTHVLFLGGGDTIELVRRVREHDLVESFREARATARLVFGISAGACAAAPYTIGYEDGGSGRIEACLDMGCPAPLDVHDEENDWPEMRALLELARARPELAQEGIVLPRGAALLVRPDGTLASLGSALAERRRLGPGGEWITTPIARP
ncbi:MAG TPA: Type 1 glutamine amidotransferase-like domain-containing protein [Planctomycetota bacterium]|nr:Type 1 glutamine amidotransferase-like domain-containing protein [Planctomycetota bacterium]